MGAEMSSRLSPTDFDIVNARIDGTNIRHAELAALVQSLTVAVEALERKVEVLVRLELEDAGLVKPLNIDPDPRLLELRELVKPGIDPPDIGSLPDTGNTWNASDIEGEGVS